MLSDFFSIAYGVLLFMITDICKASNKMNDRGGTAYLGSKQNFTPPPKNKKKKKFTQTKVFSQKSRLPKFLILNF